MLRITKEIAVYGTWMTLQNALEKSLCSSLTFIQKARKGGEIRRVAEGPAEDGWPRVCLYISNYIYSINGYKS